MEDSVLSKELIEAFRPIVEMNNVRFRQVKTMLAGFIATQERDLNYMDEYMDITRIPDPTEKDYARIDRYKQEYETLIEALDNIVNDH